MRIRVSRGELNQIAEAGFAEDAVHFSADSALRYRVTVAPDGEPAARFGADELSVVLPRAAVERWLAPEEVSIRGEQPIGGGESLKILVEKDFECLTPREGEDDSDLFPNPRGGTMGPRESS